MLLLISEHPDDRLFVHTIGEELGLPVHSVAQFDAGAKWLMTQEATAIFINVSSEASFRKLESALEATVGLFSDKANPNRMHFLSSLDLSESGHLLMSPLFGSFVSTNYGDPVISGKRYSYILRGSLDERIFGPKKLFSSAAKTQQVAFASTSQKQSGVEGVRNFLLHAKFKSRMATIISNAVDELVMNAMFDAPVDPLGKQIYLTTSRNTVLTLKDRSVVEMSVAYDGDYVGISAVDQWGSLDKQKLFEHLSRRYAKEEYRVKSTSAGAGIGLATVFRTGGSFLFACEKGVRTEVTTFFRKTDNFREFKDQFRFIATQFYF